MNRDHYSNSAYRPAGRVPADLPIEELLRARFANRGLGAVSVSAAKEAQARRMAQNPAPRPAGTSGRRPNPQTLPAQKRKSAPAHAVAAKPSRAITESRPHISQKVPLYEVKAAHRMPLPVAAMVALIVCTLTVLTVVTGSALVGRASDEVSELKNEAAALAATERELTQELDRKNDLRTIERIAVDELGMIPTDLITKKYISFSGIDVIEAYTDDREESVGLSTLLSAIGIGVE